MNEVDQALEILKSKDISDNALGKLKQLKEAAPEEDQPMMRQIMEGFAIKKLRNL